jgi:UPF0755 protein
MKVRRIARWLISLCIVAAVGYAGYYGYTTLIEPKQLGEEASIFEIQRGQNLDQIAANLQREGFIRSDLTFSLYARARGYSASLQAGKYALSGNLNAIEILNKIRTGDAVFDDVVVTFPEGWSIRQMGALLEDRGLFSQAAFEEAATMRPEYRDLWALERVDQGQLLEGYLFPDTYHVFPNSTPESVVRKMVGHLQEQLSGELIKEIRNQERTLHDVLTLASIVQREAPEEDMQEIAGVFWKRLVERWYLESDATINYILRTNKLQPTFADTEVESPYNTYQNFGLPPGPIGNPGLRAIKAALHPQENPYYFFLHKPDGETVFSRTFREHIQAKRRYLD